MVKWVLRKEILPFDPLYYLVDPDAESVRRASITLKAEKKRGSIATDKTKSVE